jgi:hypothetical protein
MAGLKGTLHLDLRRKITTDLKEHFILTLGGK